MNNNSFAPLNDIDFEDFLLSSVSAEPPADIVNPINYIGYIVSEFCSGIDDEYEKLIYCVNNCNGICSLEPLVFTTQYPKTEN